VFTARYELNVHTLITWTQQTAHMLENFMFPFLFA